jgi:Lrp/AsnC family leucine-responsive transcriptional regulator
MPRANDKPAVARPIRLDAIDLAILRELQRSSKITNAMLAERIGISPPSTMERVRKLETSGVIRGYVALLSAEALNKNIEALVLVTLTEHSQASLAKAKQSLSIFDEVGACWHTAGDDDFVLRVLVQDMPAYEQFISRKLASVPGISRIRTAFVLSTCKNTTQIPLDCVQPSPPRSEAARRNGAGK